MAQPNKAAPDWERIEADYRAGVLSVREIAAAQGISHTAINKRAKAEGWERDLSKRIQAKADALVSRREVSSAVSTETSIPDRVIVEANAEVIARIRLAHRCDIARSRKVAMSLLDELEAVTNDPELFERLGELVLDTGSDAESKLMEAYRRVTSAAGRIDSMKKLAETLKTLIGLEREAYSIATETGAGAAAAGKALIAVTDPIEAAKAYAQLMNP
ncbi:hypothetical protein KTE49_30325 [Burkholderia multivorans]|uniref:hypothetical protein n=1 Tax=Burkholderia multivorans TaxID=87883 RepID=UPI0015894C98|nr:hypothetical protein [Burkholderia multivorans]MBU9534731.1 hypothetical protein [Burkholderia multivorans]MDR8787968.1 hypothetical protein [Burkholderia multivorans]MDR8828921.1 hypothetical protein [Burkholderia multivorans]